MQLVGAGDDGCVYVWDASDGKSCCGWRDIMGLSGVWHGVPMAGCWPLVVAEKAGRSSCGRLSGQRVQALAEHPGVAFAVAWSPSGEMLISGGSDGRLRWVGDPRAESVCWCERHSG